MNLLFILQSLTLISFLLCANKVLGRGNLFNVLNYTPHSEGDFDTTKSLLAAWSEACKNESGGIITVPEGTYLVNSINFQGPCTGHVAFNIMGTLKAPNDPSVGAEHWIMFTNIYGLTISGNGTFDGQGSIAWPQNNCTQGPCPTLPVTMKFNDVRDALIQGITSLNSKYFHFHIFDCENMTISDISITAPGDSPNTDGMHIAYSNNIQITDLHIATGDDCISLGPGSTNINISGVLCGPGHGISIGSLGKIPEEPDVHGITVSNCTLSGTQNGVRIKTWAPSPPSSVFDVTFQNIFVDSVYNPIIIDQLYCPYPSCDHQGDSEVQIRNVKFINIRGSSSSEVSVDFNCSKSVPCQDIVLQDLDLTFGNRAPTNALCSGFNGTFFEHQIPDSCINTS